MTSCRSKPTTLSISARFSLRLEPHALTYVKSCRLVEARRRARPSRKKNFESSWKLRARSFLANFYTESPQPLTTEPDQLLARATSSGVDLTFAIQLAAPTESECQIQSSTRIQYLLVVL